ncbi:Putative N2,N2-dimethylguanosine tRNA methyltransferase [Phaffia rhodozyma]|uniref:Putative N2,N2-dimethylguanosine tRNA methyltransferase n=1 Tax=Phaffia rhodozyma TaxID=264483 RepID=A0A0F7SJE1_PHARH|nr:Putative N2,N2-dimethylguanosine tRNA methyltransferase [Phaffia rhodozyma]
MLPPPVPPSLFLPHIGRDLSAYSPVVLLGHTEHLRSIFLPPVLGSGKEEPAVPPDSGYSSDSEVPSSAYEEDLDDALLNDEFEQNYARGWLTRIVKGGEVWIEESEDDAQAEREAKERVVDAAASLLAIWSGTTAAGAILRTVDLPRNLALTINDAPYSSQAPDSVGVQTWGSSILFARRLAKSPSTFDILPSSSSSPQRILELGAGTGVLSLTLGSLPGESIHRDSLIVATDFHPLVLENLKKNMDLNFDQMSDKDGSELNQDTWIGNAGAQVLVRPLDWLFFHQDVETSITVGRDGTRNKEDVGDLSSLIGSGLDAPFHQRFDVIFGADIIYESHHSPWIKSTVLHFLAFPKNLSGAAASDPSFHMFMPLRPTHSVELRSVESTFPLASSLPSRNGRSSEELAWRLAVTELEDVLTRERGVGRADERGYRRYRIGWV